MTWNNTAQNYLQNRAPLIRRWLFWAEAKNRSTGGVETIGIWDGDDHETFTIDGVSRLYLGAGSLFKVSPLIYATGTNIRSQDVSLSAINPAVEQLIRGYEPRLAPCDLHLALFDAASGDMIDVERMFDGVIDAAPIQTGAMGSGSVATVTMVSAARSGTRKAAAKKSHNKQRLRNGDQFRQYGDISGTSGDIWAGKK